MTIWRILNIENSIADCEQMKASAEQKVLTADTIYQMLLGFDQFFDKMDKADQRKLIETLISEVRLYPKETWEKGKSPVKEIRYAFPVDDQILGKIQEKVATVETVILLSKLREAKHYVSVTLDMDEMDLTSAESKATYEEIKKYVAEHNDGMKVSSLNIAHVKGKCGLELAENFNLPKSEDAKQLQCPKEKEDAIVKVLKAFKMI